MNYTETEMDFEYCAKKTKQYEWYLDGVEFLKSILSQPLLFQDDGKFGDLGQKMVYEQILMRGFEIDEELPEISREYVNLLNEALSKCPFTKEDVLRWENEKETTTEPTKPIKRGFWERLFG